MGLFGGDSSSSTSSTTQEYSNAFNTNVTQSLSNGGLGITTQGTVNANGLTYALNSGNTTSSTNSSLGASSPISSGTTASGGGGPLPFDLSAILPWVIVAAVALYIIHSLRKKQ